MEQLVQQAALEEMQLAVVVEVQGLAELVVEEQAVVLVADNDLDLQDSSSCPVKARHS